MIPVVSTPQTAIANQSLVSNIAVSQASTNKGLLSGVEEKANYSGTTFASSIATPDNRAPIHRESDSQVNLAEAGPINGFVTNAAIVGKHAGFAALGAMPFIATGVTYALYELCNLPAFDAVKNTVMVGAGLTAIGSLLSYPLGRFVMAPAVQKTYDALMPDELKTVANETIAAMPKAVTQGVNATMRSLKEAHKTVPQALINTGLGIASLTEGGAKAAIQTVKENTESNAQLGMAQQNLQINTP